MVTFLKFLVVLIPLCIGSSIAVADDVKIMNKTSCFKRFPTYQHWEAMIKSRNPNMPKEQYQKIISEEEFNYARDNMDCKSIVYISDGHWIFGYQITPQAADKTTGKQYPVIIFNRGGNGPYGASTFAYLFKYMIPLAKEGYIVLASQYRGLNPKNPKVSGLDEFGGKDVNDVLALFDIVPTLPAADEDNIMMLGVSRGAMMNYLVLKQKSNVRAVASIAGPTDLELGLEWRPEMENVYKKRIPNYLKNKKEALENRSVLRWVDQLPKSTGILLLHGEQDKRVNVNQSKLLNAALDKEMIPNKMTIYPQGEHKLDKFNSEVLAEIKAWFKLHVKQVNADE